MYICIVELSDTTNSLYGKFLYIIIFNKTDEPTGQ